MISNIETLDWVSIGTATGDHLWQSTLFVGAAIVLTLALQRNRASVRHWIWLATSLKFLVPFSLLVGLGSHFEWPKTINNVGPGQSIIQIVSEPFTAMDAVVPAQFTPAGGTTNGFMGWLLGAGWLFGFTAVIIHRHVRSRRLAAHLDLAPPLKPDGPEMNSLRRVQLRRGSSWPIKTASSTTMMEPGVHGVLRPVLILPANIADRLSEDQLDAIVAHELAHIGRHDNLTAAIHMVVETIFWFFPLVWWIGSRLVDERERACDAEVLHLGSNPETYAGAILNVCEFYLASPLISVSGVTGSNLKKRIETIMMNKGSTKLSFTKKALLAIGGMMTLIVPVVIGSIHETHQPEFSTATQTPQIQLALTAPPPVGTAVVTTGESSEKPSLGIPSTPQPAPIPTAQSLTPRLTFEVASIKPNIDSQFRPGTTGAMRLLPGGRLSTTGAILRLIIFNAYSLRSYQVLGGPNWIDSERFDIEAKPADSATPPQVRLMIQSLLEDRFKLKAHRETRDLPVYELSVANGGLKLSAPKEADCITPDPGVPPAPPVPGQLRCGIASVAISTTGSRMLGRTITMAAFTSTLSNLLGRTVIDKSGFTGTFDLEMTFALDQALAGLPVGAPGTPGGIAIASDPGAVTIFTALQEQLGLRLDSAKGPVEVLVIDSVERPTEN